MDINYVDRRDCEVHTTLIFAAYRNNPEMVKLLLDAGADPNLLDSSGKTALMLAGKKDHKDIASLLRDAMADK